MVNKKVIRTKISPDYLEYIYLEINLLLLPFVITYQIIALHQNRYLQWVQCAVQQRPI